jgi:hypothetical protein
MVGQWRLWFAHGWWWRMTICGDMTRSNKVSNDGLSWYVDEWLSVLADGFDFEAKNLRICSHLIRSALSLVFIYWRDAGALALRYSLCSQIHCVRMEATSSHSLLYAKSEGTLRLCNLKREQELQTKSKIVLLWSRLTGFTHSIYEPILWQIHQCSLNLSLAARLMLLHQHLLVHTWE